MVLMDFAEGERFINEEQPDKSWFVMRGGKVMDCFYIKDEFVEMELSDIFQEHFKTMDTWQRFV